MYSFQSDDVNNICERQIHIKKKKKRIISKDLNRTEFVQVNSSDLETDSN